MDISAYPFDLVSADGPFDRPDSANSFFTAFDGLPNSGSICPSPVAKQGLSISRPSSLMSAAPWPSLADAGYHDDQGLYPVGDQELYAQQQQQQQQPPRPLTPYSSSFSAASLPPSRSCTPASFQLPPEAPVAYRGPLSDFPHDLHRNSFTTGTRSPSPSMLSSYDSPSSMAADYMAQPVPPFDAAASSSSMYLTSTPSSLSLSDLPVSQKHHQDYQPNYYEDPLFQSQSQPQPQPQQPYDDIAASPVQMPSTSMFDYPNQQIQLQPQPQQSFPFYSNPQASLSATSLHLTSNQLDQRRPRDLARPHYPLNTKRLSLIQRAASQSPSRLARARPLSRPTSALSLRTEPAVNPTPRPGYPAKPPLQTAVTTPSTNANGSSSANTTTTTTTTSSSSSSSSSHNEMSFVNFTTRDRRKLLSGVAPSGSSKTKARREKLAKEKINKKPQ